MQATCVHLSRPLLLKVTVRGCRMCREEAERYLLAAGTPMDAVEMYMRAGELSMRATLVAGSVTAAVQNSSI